MAFLWITLIVFLVLVGISVLIGGVVYLIRQGLSVLASVIASEAKQSPLL